MNNTVSKASSVLKQGFLILNPKVTRHETSRDWTQRNEVVFLLMILFKHTTCHIPRIQIFL